MSIDKASCQPTASDRMLVRKRTIEVWKLDQAETDRIFDDKWRQHLRSSRSIAELDAATNLLCRYLKHDRIPSIVRTPIPGRDEVSLIKMLEQGDTKTLLTTCCDMFRFEQVHA